MENLTDSELLVYIQKNQEYLGIVYKRCKKYCMKFMLNMTSNKLNNYELEDVFQDSIIIFYEKIVNDNFVLTSSIQTYLNSVCRFQLLNKLNKEKNSLTFEENSNVDEDDINMKFLPSITDDFEQIENETEEQFVAIEKALEKMKSIGNHCYELLTLYWYHKKSHQEIAEIMNYSNDKTSKKQKSGCQEKLRKMAFNELKN
jgi:RNA polymerase sigma factor (sigma-70 family)